MLRLTLVRHAKAVPARNGDTDFDRGLSPEGIVEAREMATRFATRGARPDLILASAAARASHTAALFAQAWQDDTPEIKLQGALYLAAPETVLDAIHALPERGHVMIVGHNPGISELARRLAVKPIGDLSTAAVLMLEFAVTDWTAIGAEEPARFDLESPAADAETVNTPAR